MKKQRSFYKDLLIKNNERSYPLPPISPRSIFHTSLLYVELDSFTFRVYIRWNYYYNIIEMKTKLDKLVRDLTKVHPLPKSKVREMIEEHVESLNPRKSKKWFMDRVGKRIYRDESDCPCIHCRTTAKEGLIVIDKIHAEYLYDTQNDFGAEGLELNYRDEK